MKEKFGKPPSTSSEQLWGKIKHKIHPTPIES